MSYITHIPAEQITEDHTLYIDALHGYVIAISEYEYEDVDDVILITWRDANGEHTRLFFAEAEIPVLTAELAA